MTVDWDYVRATTFREMANRAYPVVDMAWTSDLYRDAQWLQEHLSEGAGPEIQFFYSVRSTGTAAADRWDIAQHGAGRDDHARLYRFEVTVIDDLSHEVRVTDVTSLYNPSQAPVGGTEGRTP